MARGDFSFIKEQEPYQSADKEWYVELDRSDMVWYDLIESPPDFFNTKKYYSDYLLGLNNSVKNESNKKFIYFIGTRIKVRFSLKKKAKYSIFNKKLIFFIEIGKEKKLKKVKIDYPISDINGIPIRAEFELTERFIIFHLPFADSVFLSIYDFLNSNNIQLGINTEIHYVGYTDNPSKRVINNTHKGLSRIFYKYPSNEYDFLIFYNIFKITSIAKNDKYSMNFIVANTVLDEIKSDKEGLIIEKAIIYYFDTDIQKVNKAIERGELRNNLIKLSQENRIRSITIDIQIKESYECYNFYSRKVPASDKHIFNCTINNEELEIDSFLSDNYILDKFVIS